MPFPAHLGHTVCTCSQESLRDLLRSLGFGSATVEPSPKGVWGTGLELPDEQPDLLVMHFAGTKSATHGQLCIIPRSPL